MSQNARLIDGPGSELWTTLSYLAQCNDFTAALGKAIRTDNGENAARAVQAMHRELLGEPPQDLNATDDHFTIVVSYTLPPYTELNGTLFDWAADPFSDGHNWMDHASICELIDRTPGPRDFLVKHFSKKMTSEQVIAWTDANGYRVATRAELVSVGQARPDLQRQFPIAALGSSTFYDCRRCVAVLSRDGAKRILVDDWFDRRWDAYDRFLLVRK